MVEDTKLQKKHVNLFEPVMFYRPDTQTPVELVVTPGEGKLTLYSNEPGFTRELTMPEGVTIEAVLPVLEGGDPGQPRRILFNRGLLAQPLPTFTGLALHRDKYLRTPCIVTGSRPLLMALKCYQPF